MNTNILIKIFLGSALMLLASCTSNDLIDVQGNILPEGKYPLQIASVSLSAEVTDEPWGANHAPQTRVAENEDRGGSHWENGDKIHVQINGGGFDKEELVCTLNEKGEVTDYDKTLYWKSSSPATYTAWYNTADQYDKVTLSNQSQKLAYVLTCEGNAGYNTPMDLKFTHALAKVRVVVQGGDASKVTDVKIWSNTSCTHTEGGTITGTDDPNWITMNKIDNGGAKYWEANVVPDATIPQLLVNEDKTVDLKNGGIKPLPAKINTITLTAGEMTYNLNDYTSGGTINVTGKATITGSPKSPYLQINLYEGADVTLQDVDIKNHNSPITCEGNVTITLSGNNKIIGGNGTLSVSGENSTLTIKEVSPSGGSLELKTSDAYSPSALSLNNGANLIIESGTITADASTSAEGGNSAVGIGSWNSGNCGDITINGGTIIAKGGIGGPGIGAGVYGTCGIITITGGKIEAIGGHGFYGSSFAACGAGIGAGTYASYKEIKIIGNAKVTATGSFFDTNRWAYDIGPGYNFNSNCGTVTIANPSNVTATNNRIYKQ
ncbi:MAG: fimbrillin family protein [Methanocorpusculum sp.]|nr:fimbrillin family protein [Methanocorpusculum sp.]